MGGGAVWLLAFLSAATPKAAQEESPVPNQTVEISPAGGFAGASPAFGLRAMMGYQTLALEISGDQNVCNVAALFPITINAVIDLAQTKRAVPYGVVGGGLFLTVPSNAVGSKTISTLGLCYGGGLRYYLTRLFGLRFEYKLFLTEYEAKGENAESTRRELLSFQYTSLGVIFGIP
jgi:hypothetical protein